MLLRKSFARACMASICRRRSVAAVAVTIITTMMVNVVVTMTIMKMVDVVIMTIMKMVNVATTTIMKMVNAVTMTIIKMVNAVAIIMKINNIQSPFLMKNLGLNRQGDCMLLNDN